MLEEIKDYWTHRSNSYAQENLTELLTQKRQQWEAVFSKYTPVCLQGAKVLDIGCGPGIFSILLAGLGANVSALDYTPKMLENAQANASKEGVVIDFFQGEAQNLEFQTESFDLVVSRNLTWNLKDPFKAYQEWYRVLKKGGRMMNFDANWYLHLYDQEQKRMYEKNRAQIAKLGMSDHMTNAYPNAAKMEEIAQSLPLSRVYRPQWDMEVLASIGFEILVCNKEFYQEIWDDTEKLMFASTPMFCIMAQK